MRRDREGDPGRAQGMGLASHLGKWQRRKAQGTHASVSPLVKWEDAPPTLASSTKPPPPGPLRESHRINRRIMAL